MKQNERAGIMRIVSDIVKADSIIDLREIDYLDGIKDKYRITKDDEAMGDSMTLSDAVCLLKNLSPGLIHDIIGDFYNLALSDNAFSREEGLIVLAIIACLSEKYFTQAEIYSTVLPNNTLAEKSQILYIEGEYYKEANKELRTDPYALETVFVSVIVFAGKEKVLSPLTELYKFYPPQFPIGGGTSLGTALDCLMNDIDKSVKKTTVEMKGDWKPIIFLFTDGMPTDNPQQAFNRWNAHYKRKANLVCISIGDNTDTKMLGKISDNVLRLNDTGEQSFKAFFKWVTASIKSTSVSVTDMGTDEIQLASTSGIDLEKVDTTKDCTVDENFVVLLGKCSNTKKEYLIKYAKRVGKIPGLEQLDVKGIDYKLVGAYPIDDKAYEELSDGKSNRNINTMSLIGVPTCPCCGNQFGVVVCECGNIMCSDGQTTACPWCGMEGSLGAIGDGGLDITRGRG